MFVMILCQIYEKKCDLDFLFQPKASEFNMLTAASQNTANKNIDYLKRCRNLFDANMTQDTLKGKCKVTTLNKTFQCFMKISIRKYLLLVPNKQLLFQTQQ